MTTILAAADLAIEYSGVSTAKGGNDAVLVFRAASPIVLEPTGFGLNLLN
jgi:hypothetical protein